MFWVVLGLRLELPRFSCILYFSFGFAKKCLSRNFSQSPSCYMLTEIFRVVESSRAIIPGPHEVRAGLANINEEAVNRRTMTSWHRHRHRHRRKVGDTLFLARGLDISNDARCFCCVLPCNANDDAVSQRRFRIRAPFLRVAPPSPVGAMNDLQMTRLGDVK